MKKFNSFPDLAKSAELLKISMDLENVSDNTFLGIAILKAVREGKIKQCIEMIQSQANDNYSMMADIVGVDLLERIMNYNNPNDIPNELFTQSKN